MNRLIRQVHIGELKVLITREANKKLQAYIDLCPKEISGFGIVERDGGNFLVKDIFILKQDVSSISTEMDPDALFNALEDAASRGVDTRDWSFWWHSHVNMGVSPSDTDLKTIEKLSSSEPLVTLIQNKDGDRYSRVDVYEPLRFGIINVPITVVEERDDALVQKCRLEISKKVKFKPGDWKWQGPKL